MSRTNQILAGILALQVVVAVVVFWPRTSAVAAGEPLFPDIEAEQVAWVRIEDPASGEIELERTDVGWVLAGTDGFPCTETAVSTFLEKVLALDTARLVTETPASHARLEVAEDSFSRRIAFRLEDGTAHTFYLGSSPSYNVAHVRLEGQDRAYLVSGLSATDASVRATAWIDALYVSLESDQVVALTLENDSGTYAFAKDADGAWSMAGLSSEETLNEGEVSSLVTRISSVRMQRPLGQDEDPGYGMGDPQAVVTVQTRDEEGATETQILVVGAQDAKDNTYVVKASTSPYYVRVAEFAVQDFVEETRADLIEQPPTPTVEATATPQSAP
jgi:hypothetical protein